MQITNNKYNTMPEQVQENKDNIKSILAGIKELYSTTETLNEQSETIEQSLTTVPRGTKKGFLIDAEANLFNILSVVENVVYIKYMTNLKGVQGEQGVKGDKGDKGEKGDKGDAGTGFVNITDINLVVGEPSVLYDTEDGITITSQGELITEDAQYTPTVEQNIPLIAGYGLTMDATEDGQHVDIHLSAETQSKIERSLKSPISTPTSTKIIAVDNTNSQELLGIGTGLEESNGDIKVEQSLIDQVQDIQNKANKDLSNVTVVVEKIETIYDKNSSDSNINWGYTSGIQLDGEVTGKDFSKYKKLNIYLNGAFVNCIINLDLTTPVTRIYKAGYSYYGGTVVVNTDAPSYIIKMAVLVSTSKTSINFYICGYQNVQGGGAFNNAEQSEQYAIYKIEGVY